MKMFYVTATELVKNKEVTQVHAIFAKDNVHLKERCDRKFINWTSEGHDLDGFQLNSDWDNLELS